MAQRVREQKKMTPGAFKTYREILGVSNARLAELLNTSGTRIIYKWASGETPVPGPVSALMRIFVQNKIPKK